MHDRKFFLLALALEDTTNEDLTYLVKQMKLLVEKFTRAGNISDQQALAQEINKLVDDFFDKYVTNLTTTVQGVGTLQATEAINTVIPLLRSVGLYRLAINLYQDIRNFEASVEKRLMFSGWAGKPLNFTLKTVKAGTQKTILNIIHNGVKDGKGAKEIAKMLEQYMKPVDPKSKIKPLDQYRKRFGRPKSFTPKNMPVGSLQYNALRIARTETAHMYRQATLEFYDGKPFIKGFTYVLSNRHPKKDICDEYSKKIYPTAKDVPLTHPNCLCRIDHIMFTRAELKQLKDGDILMARAVEAAKKLVKV